MNLWTIGEVSPHNYEEELHWVAFWSWGSDEAVDYWRSTYPDQYHIHESEYCVHRIADPSGIPEPETPRPVHNRGPLRLMGWRCPGDDCCGSCGLYSMDGDVPVCEECDNCKECGCYKECCAYQEQFQ